MWYQAELMIKDRQERIRREADEARQNRLEGGRAHGTARPRRVRFLSRS